MNMFEVIMHKDTYFTFEQEIRAVVLPPASDAAHIDHFSNCLLELETDSTFRCLAPPISVSSLISDVVLHPEATAEFSKHIAALCAAHELPNPVASRRTRELGR